MAATLRVSSGLWRTLFMGSAVTGGLYFTLQDQRYWKSKSILPTEKERLAIFDRLSNACNHSFHFDELFLRMSKHRQRLISQASGKVLEVAAGNGNNLEYYNKNGQIEQVYFVDKSTKMVNQLKEKPISKQYENILFKEFMVNDSENLGYKNNEFDCVIDTFGLCSYENPEQALNEMIRVVKPGMKLLLLEHGKSNWGLIESWQNGNMLKHVNNWGCYMNRDILSYLENRNDIEISKLERRHFGTTYYIEAIKRDVPSIDERQINFAKSNIANRSKKAVPNPFARSLDINVMVNVS